MSGVRVALVVGIDNYPDQPLLGCVNDAKDVATCLALSEYGFGVNMLLDSRAGRARVLEELSSIVYGDEGEGEFFLFYFAGHGAVRAGAAHLVAQDSTNADPGIPFATLASYMEAASSKFKHVVAILDCCHSGAAFTWSQVRPLVNADIEKQLPSVNESRCILAACGPAQGAGESPGANSRGFFTQALVTGLLGDAVDFDGNVTLLGIHEFLSRAMNPSEQTPVFKGDISGTVILGSGFEPRKGAPIAPSQKREILAKAQGMIDSYHHLEMAEVADRAYRLAGGSRNCADRLEGMVGWFEEKAQSLPELTRDADWLGLCERLRDYQARLAEISEGELLIVGQAKRRIGQGGYGQVWEVEREGKRVALKVFHGNELSDQVKVQRFKAGFANMQRLHHERIVPVSELRLAPFGFLMDYVDGIDLRRMYLDRSDSEALVRLLKEVGDTVAYAHSKGVRHRDIKPENIIVVDANGRLIPYLTDFDLAYHETNRTITTNLGVGGVINYAAPEQLYEPNASRARQDTVDVFSLAQLMFFVLVGYDPSAEHAAQNLQKLKVSTRGWLDERAVKVLLDLYERSTQRDPQSRPQSMREFVAELGLALNYVSDTASTDGIAEGEFLPRAAYIYAGIGSYSVAQDRVEMKSVSGVCDIVLRGRPSSRSNSIDLEIEVSVSERLPVPSFKTGSQARSAINARLDKALSSVPNSRRRNGNKGAYQVFVDLSHVPLNVTGMQRLQSALTLVVDGIESWG